MPSAICIDLDQSKILLSSNGLIPCFDLEDKVFKNIAGK